jgi:hypothetical protein
MGARQAGSVALVRTWSADSAASPAAAWALLSRPRAWPAWAPHLRGAWGLAEGRGEVRAGALGAARLLGVAPVPVRITDKRPGRAWSWRPAPGVEMTHRVEPRDGGCTVAIDLTAPPGVEAAIALAYGPVIALTLRRLATVAAQGPPRER